MLRYTLHRLLIMIPTLLVISFVTFAIIKLPPGTSSPTRSPSCRARATGRAREGRVPAKAVRARQAVHRAIRDLGRAWPTEGKFSGLLQGDCGWSFEHDMR
jgi:peptide/nickel transport system permease protein